MARHRLHTSLPLAQLLSTFSVVHGRQQSDPNGYGVIAKRQIKKGEVFADPTAMVVTGDPTEQSDPDNAGEIILGHGFYVVIARHGSASSLTYIINEQLQGKPNFKWKVNFNTRPATLQWVALQDIGAGEEIKVVYNQLLRRSRRQAVTAWQVLDQQIGSATYDAPLDVHHRPVAIRGSRFLLPPPWLSSPSDVVTRVNTTHMSPNPTRQIVSARRRRWSVGDKPCYPGLEAERVSGETGWNGASYGSIYFGPEDTTYICNQLGFHLPPWAELTKTEHQLFLSFGVTRSQTHRDQTSSILHVISGSKVIFLAHPTVGDRMTKWPEFPNFLTYDPFHDDNRPPEWHRVDLQMGESLLIPRHWWHNVQSTAGTIGLSLNVKTRPRDNTPPTRRVTRQRDSTLPTRSTRPVCHSSRDIHNGAAPPVKRQMAAPPRRRSKRVKSSFVCGTCQRSGRANGNLLWMFPEDNIPDKKPPMVCDEHRSEGAHKYVQISRVDYEKWGEKQPTKYFHFLSGKIHSVIDLTDD